MHSNLNFLWTYAINSNCDQAAIRNVAGNVPRFRLADIESRVSLTPCFFIRAANSS